LAFGIYFFCIYVYCVDNPRVDNRHGVGVLALYCGLCYFCREPKGRGP
jgi:hypothetical protein